MREERVVGQEHATCGTAKLDGKSAVDGTERARRSSGLRRLALTATVTTSLVPICMVSVVATTPLLISSPAWATCSNAAPPYIISGPNGVDLDNECAGAPGQATVTSNINGGILNSDANASGWAIVVNNSISVAGTEGLRFLGSNALINNFGTIAGTATTFDDGQGVFMNQDGSVINQAGAEIRGISQAVRIVGSGSVNNNGLIAATGTFSEGVMLRNGGSVINGATGEIRGTVLGVEIRGASGTIDNSGYIRSTGGGGEAVLLRNGGIVTNQRAGRIHGSGEGVVIFGGMGEVINSAEITGFGDDGIDLRDGGSVTNQAGGTITGDDRGIGIEGGAGTVTNAGSIVGERFDGVLLNNGGSVTNEMTGTVTGDDFGVEINGAAGTVINSGSIEGQTAGGVRMNTGGTVTNNAMATITGQTQGVQISGGTATLTNAGTITSATTEGIRISGAAGTITNAGTITGGGAFAIRFDVTTPQNDRMELQPGSMINGNVLAGGGVDTLAFGGTGTMNFDISLVDGDNTFDGEQYLNFEVFEKEDDSSVTFTGTNTEIENFAVNGGVLNVNGTMGSTAFSIANGGTLGGTGTVGSFVNSGTVAPGNSIGTMNITNDVTFNAGSIYNVEIASDGTSDLIAAGGRAFLNGNGQVNPILLSPEMAYTDGQTFTILTADGGVNGEFSGVNDTSALLDYSLTHNSNDVVLNVALVDPIGVAPNFPMFATTFNQSAVAEVLIPFDFSGNPEGIAVLASLFSLNAEELAAAYDSLSGEVYASGTSMGVNIGGQFTNLLMSNASGASPTVHQVPLGYTATDVTPHVDQFSRRYGADAPPLTEMMAAPIHTPVLSAWLGGFGAAVDVDTDGNASAWSSDSWGISTGLEADLSLRSNIPATIGFGVGYSATNGDLGSRNQAVDVESWHLGVYGQAGAAPLEQGFVLQGAVSYAHQTYDARRQISFGGISRIAEASYHGGVVSGAVEARYQIPIAFDFGTAVFSPMLRAELSHGWTDGFTETGAGALNLAVASNNHAEGSIAVGAKIGGQYMLGDVSVKPSLMVAYERVLGSDAPDVSLLLGGSPTVFVARGPAESRDRIRLGAAATFELNERVSLNLSSDRNELSGKAGLKIEF